MRFRLFRFFLAAVLISSTGWALAASVTAEHLLSGEVLFSKTIDVNTIPDPKILETDETMRAFVAEHVGGAKSAREKLRRLLNGMVDSGLLSLDYAQTETKSARQTFYDRSGNCISFTNLFVALGREAGLRVYYQTVDVPPIWYSDSDLVILNNHINALIDTNFEGRVVVDFNVAEFKGNYASHPVTDKHAAALYHNNIAMDALTEGDLEESFRYLKKAILLDPDVAGPWVNLGVFYSRQDMPRYAFAAYKRGLDLDPENRSGLTNMAHLYRSQGKDAIADRYSRKVRHYQRRNPYYHYYRARFSYENDNTDQALESVNKAIKLKNNEHQFHFLLGKINFSLGRHRQALESFVLAKELAGYESEQRKYESKIDLLANMQADNHAD